MLLLLTASTASAHIAMTYPLVRYSDQKQGPCGRGATDARTANVTEFAPGETITVTWNETINHPSHYRISIDLDGQDDFADPPDMKAFYSNTAVLLDNISDVGGPAFQAQITLPNVECENCTLQLVQVMYDKPPYVPGTNDLYYQCADIALRGPVQPTDTGAPTDTGTVPDTGTIADTSTDTGANTGLPPLTLPDDKDEAEAGCACAAAPAPGPAALAWLGALALLWRRRA